MFAFLEGDVERLRNLLHSGGEDLRDFDGFLVWLRTRGSVPRPFVECRLGAMPPRHWDHKKLELSRTKQHPLAIWVYAHPHAPTQKA